MVEAERKDEEMVDAPVTVEEKEVVEARKEDVEKGE
jgi:hypothetical protein